MPAAWDSGLPQYEVAASGFRMQLPDPVVRVKMDNGTTKAAPIASQAPTLLTLTYRMTAAQFTTFRSWLTAVLESDQMFTKTVLGTPYTFLIVGPVSPQPANGGLQYDVAIDVEEVL